MDVEDQLTWVDGLDEAFELSVVRVRGVWDFEVEG